MIDGPPHMLSARRIISERHVLHALDILSGVCHRFPCGTPTSARVPCVNSRSRGGRWPAL